MVQHFQETETGVIPAIEDRTHLSGIADIAVALYQHETSSTVARVRSRETTEQEWDLLERNAGSYRAGVHVLRRMLDDVYHFDGDSAFTIEKRLTLQHQVNSELAPHVEEGSAKQFARDLLLERASWNRGLGDGRVLVGESKVLGSQLQTLQTNNGGVGEPMGIHTLITGVIQRNLDISPQWNIARRQTQNLH